MNRERFEQRRSQVEAALQRVLPPDEGPAARVVDAMRHALFAGGKRLRPVLGLASFDACGGQQTAAIEEALCALELLHTYSLIHDDLPAMDDDDLRRGQPTVHKAYDEATAILAGDAMHTLAFELLASRPPGDAAASARADACVALAQAAGTAGMVGGQMADLLGEGVALDAPALEWIHRHKTGALLAASAQIGAIYAGASTTVQCAFHGYGTALGLAFQIADDILDVTATAEEIGKTPGKDHATGKATYPALYGLDGARDHAERCVQQAVDELRDAGIHSDELEELATFASRRSA